MLRGVLLIGVIIVFLGSCTSTQQLSSRDLYTISDQAEIKYKVFFKSNEPFLAVQTAIKNYRLDLRLYQNKAAESLIWSKIIDYKDITGETVHLIPLATTLSIFSLDIRIVCDNKILFHDIYYANQQLNFEESIYLKGEQDNLILHKNVKKGELFTIHNNTDSIDQFFIKYIASPQSVAAPPHGKKSGYVNANQQDFDNLFTIPKGKKVKLKQEGLYYIQTDSTSSKGIAINYFGEDFPKMNRISDLILGTRYITKNEEYKSMQDAVNPKKALDEYWLARNHNKADARRLISIYYNRMQKANESFTTFKEGWKTDKGIIYIIFGQPHNIHKFPKKEVWYYHYKNAYYPVKFVFNRVGEQSILERSRTFRESWNMAVSRWRTGHIRK